MKIYGKLIAIFAAVLLIAGTAMPTLLAADRYSGDDRYATAAEISKNGWQNGSVVVVLARGDVFADALAGVPLAYAHDAPILLTMPDKLPQVTKDEIARLNPSKIYILGGTSAVSQGVQDELQGMGIEVERISGENRFDTAANIADTMAPDGAGTVFLAYGLNFPDALAAAAYAAQLGAPILLTLSDEIPEETLAALAALGPNQIFVVGGPAAISDDTLEGMENVTRIYGQDRYGTSVALAQRFAQNASTMYIATGSDAFGGADALTGAVLAARQGTGILLVGGTLPDEVAEFLGNSVQTVFILGGSSAVPPGVADDIEESLYEPDSGGGVYVPVDNISIPEVLTLLVDETIKIKAVISPADATNKGVIWTSSDETIAKVDALGNVTALNYGIATITATSVANTAIKVTGTVVVANDWSDLADTAWYTGEEPYTINTAQELAGLAMLVNNEDASVDFSGKAITLGSDINLLGLEWVPIGTGEKPFKGNFNGAGKTISNLKIDAPESCYAGLFGNVVGGSLSNVNLTGVSINAKESVGSLTGKAFTLSEPINNVHVADVEINSTHWAGGIVGYNYASVRNCSANNVRITLSYDSTIDDNGDKAGGITGYQGESSYVYEDCSVNEATISGVRDVGGLVGASGGGLSYKNCQVTNSDINADNTTGTHAQPYAGGFIGRAVGSISLYGYTALNVTAESYDENYAGVLVGGPEANVATYNVWNVEQNKWHTTIQDAVQKADEGDTIRVMQGIYTADNTKPIVINKRVTLIGDNATISVSTGNQPIEVKANGTVIQGFKIIKTDKSHQDIIYVNANNVSILNNDICGQYEFGDEQVDRAILGASGRTGMQIVGNTFSNLRQPAYFNGGNTGNVEGNYVTNTRGWVVCGDSNMEFVGNEFGTNAVDIAIIDNNNGINNYGDTAEEVIALSKANNGAHVENQLSKLSAKDGELYNIPMAQ